MKIKSIYISAFGTLKNFELEFCDGFQVIYGENEAGKTTITEFIKSMFYGTGRRAAGQVISIREKYTPLDGTPAGGRVYFEHSGKEFCLERQFRKSDATDKITVTDVLSGKSEPAPSDIGKQLFGITMPAFERSVFISDTPGFSFDEAAAGEINQKLSNAALTDESVSYSKVLNRLDDARLKLISKSGKTGTLISDISRHNELIEALGESDSAARKKQELNEGIAEAKAKTEEIGARYEAAQKQLDNIKDIENAQKLKEYIELKEKLIEVTSLLTLPDGTVADEMFLKKFEFGFAKLESIKDKIQSGEKELSALETAAAAREGNTPEQIREKLDKAKEELAASEDKISGCETAINALQGEIETLGGQAEARKEKRKPVNIPLLIISIICLIASALTLHFVLGKPVITAAVGVFWLIIAALAF
ncbi:MAG: AAA family ATPase, partial [Clostridia bacterium]|nr:AAA family ATPase [Clostridia bacterium]